MKDTKYFNSENTKVLLWPQHLLFENSFSFLNLLIIKKGVYSR